MESSQPPQGKSANAAAGRPDYDIDAETLRELKNVLNKALAESEPRPAPAAGQRSAPPAGARYADRSPAPLAGLDNAFDLVDQVAELIGSTEAMIEEAQARSEEMAERILEELRVGEAEIETLEQQVREAEARAAEAEERANEVETKAADIEAMVMRLHDRIEAKLGRVLRRDASGRILAA